MPSQAEALSESPVADLEFYRTRDDFMRAYTPVTPEEKILVTQMTRAWLQLQQMYNLHDRVTAGKGLLALFEDDLPRYKILARNLTDAERMWRNSIQEFQRARRRRDPLASHRAIPRPLPTPIAKPSPQPETAFTARLTFAESQPESQPATPPIPDPRL